MAGARFKFSAVRGAGSGSSMLAYDRLGAAPPPLVFADILGKISTSLLAAIGVSKSSKS